MGGLGGVIGADVRVGTRIKMSPIAFVATSGLGSIIVQPTGFGFFGSVYTIVKVFTLG